MSQDSKLTVKSLAWILKSTFNRGPNIRDPKIKIINPEGKLNKIINPEGGNITKKNNFFWRLIMDLPTILINGWSLLGDNVLQILGNTLYSYISQKMIDNPIAQQEITEPVAEEEVTEPVAEEEVAEPVAEEEVAEPVAEEEAAESVTEPSTAEDQETTILRLRALLARHNIAE